MARNFSVLLSVAVLSAPPAWALEVPILKEGTFHGEDVPEVTMDHWYGLYQQGDDYVLSRVTLKIEPWYDQMMDNPEDDSEKGSNIDGVSKWTGKKVSAEPHHEGLQASIKAHPDDWSYKSLMLIQLMSLQEGVLNTAFPNNHHDDARVTGDFSPLSHIPMQLGNLHYVLGSDFGFGQCDISLKQYQRNADKDQYVPDQLMIRKIADNHNWSNSIGLDYEVGACDNINGYPKLLWAGDVDRDGKLDLLLEPHYHYNVSSVTLFLSSVADKGKHVRRVGHFKSTGC